MSKNSTVMVSIHEFLEGAEPVILLTALPRVHPEYKLMSQWIYHQQPSKMMTSATGDEEGKKKVERRHSKALVEWVDGSISWTEDIEGLQKEHDLMQRYRQPLMPLSSLSATVDGPAATAVLASSDSPEDTNERCREQLLRFLARNDEKKVQRRKKHVEESEDIDDDFVESPGGLDIQYCIVHHPHRVKQTAIEEQRGRKTEREEVAHSPKMQNGKRYSGSQYSAVKARSYFPSPPQHQTIVLMKAEKDHIQTQLRRNHVSNLKLISEKEKRNQYLMELQATIMMKEKKKKKSLKEATSEELFFDPEKCPNGHALTTRQEISDILNNDSISEVVKKRRKFAANLSCDICGGESQGSVYKTIESSCEVCNWDKCADCLAAEFDLLLRLKKQEQHATQQNGSGENHVVDKISCVKKPTSEDMESKKEMKSDWNQEGSEGHNNSEQKPEQQNKISTSEGKDDQDVEAIFFATSLEKMVYCGAFSYWVDPKDDPHEGSFKNLIQLIAHLYFHQRNREERNCSTYSSNNNGCEHAIQNTNIEEILSPTFLPKLLANNCQQAKYLLHHVLPREEKQKIQTLTKECLRLYIQERLQKMIQLTTLGCGTNTSASSQLIRTSNALFSWYCSAPNPEDLIQVAWEFGLLDDDHKLKKFIKNNEHGERLGSKRKRTQQEEEEAVGGGRENPLKNETSVASSSCPIPEVAFINWAEFVRGNHQYPYVMDLHWTGYHEYGGGRIYPSSTTVISSSPDDPFAGGAQYSTVGSNKSTTAATSGYYHASNTNNPAELSGGSTIKAIEIVGKFVEEEKRTATPEELYRLVRNKWLTFTLV